jgi:hypothetical protein
VSGSWGLAARCDGELCYVGGYTVSELHWSAGQRTRRCDFCPIFTASTYCNCFAFYSPRPHSENEDLRRTAIKIPELEDEVGRLGAQVRPPYCPDLLRYSLNSGGKLGPASEQTLVAIRATLDEHCVVGPPTVVQLVAGCGEFTCAHQWTIVEI